MCYSAMIKEDFLKYVRTGGRLDIHQFVDVYWRRSTEWTIKIPRAVDRLFADPETADELKVKALIDGYRHVQLQKLEQEIFGQSKRLADAERALGFKQTKAAAESKRIATDKIESAKGKLSLFKSDKSSPSDGRIFPMHYAPIIVLEDGQRVVKLARYQLDPGRRRGHYNARRDNLERFWRKQFGQTHALMVVSSFYENVDRDGKNAVLHFVPEPADDMLIACLYQVEKDADGREMWSFAAVTDEPPAEVAAAGHDRVIVNLKPENVNAWLSPAGRSDAELQAILSDKQVLYYEHQVLAA